MSAAYQVKSWQRFTRQRPCPICGGWDGARRGSPDRCWGNLSADQTLAFCTQEGAAGRLIANANGSYTHRLAGPCRCGREHGIQPTSAAEHTHTEKPTPTPRPSQRGPFPQVLDGAKLTTVYTYQREDGNRAYSVLRYEFPRKPGQEKPEKTFRQITHLDATTWVWGLGDTERVLYRLPQLIAAPPVRPVFIVEGEKAADALIALGLVATTCSEGAEKWLQAPGRHDALCNRHVVVLADNDEKGARHAQQVAADLADVAASVRVLTLPGLPEKGDVVEWIASGGTKDMLYELVIATPVEGTATAQQEPASVTAELRAREEALRKEAARRRDLEAQNAWRRQLAANRHLGATTKLVAWAVQEERTSKNLSPSDDMCVYLPNIAERAGVSPQTAGDALKKLSEAEALNRRVESHIGAGGRKVTRVTISPTPLFATPHKVIPPAPRNHGGKRCAHCGGTRFQVEQIITCADCGTVVKHDKRVIDTNTTNPDDMPTSDPFTASQVDLQGDGFDDLPVSQLDLQGDATKHTDYASQVDLPITEGNVLHGQEDTDHDTCSVCHSPDIEVYDPSGNPYCAAHGRIA